MTRKAADPGRTKKLWIAISSAVVIVIVVALSVFSMVRAQKPAAAAITTAEATVHTLAVRVSGDGDVRAATQTGVDPQVSGTVKEVFVQPGDVVNAGDVLLTLSSEDVDAALLRAAATLAQAKQAVAQANQMRAQADQTLAQAQMTVAQTDASVLQAQQALDMANAALALSPDGAGKVELAQKQLTSAQAASKTASAGTKSAQAAVTTAQAGLVAANASLASAQNAHAQAQKDLSLTTVTAPVGGLITGVSATPGGAAGSSAAASATLATSGMGVSTSSSAAGTGSAITISDVSTLQVRVAINEADLPRLALGQTAVVRVDAVPESEIAAEVTWISPNAVTTSGIVTYDVDLRLTGDIASVKPGMTATAEITTSVIEEAIVVPSQAVRVDGSNKYVEVVRAGTASKVRITTGANDAEFTQVLTGIESGDEVVTDDGSAAEKPSGGMFGGN